MKKGLQMSVSLEGLRVRHADPAIRESSHHELKNLLSEHGQHMSPKTLALFRQTLHALLTDGLRVKEITPAEKSEPSPKDWVKFIASDGRQYIAPPEAWQKVQKVDPCAKKYPSKKAWNQFTK